MEHPLVTYIRTKTVFKHRLKDLDDYDTVRLYKYELKKLGADNGPLLYSLKKAREISYDDKGNFRVLKDGPIDIGLLESTKKQPRLSAPLTALHHWMKRQLMFVDLNVPRSKMSVYFKAFLDHRGHELDSFFTVDSFAGRVHTPVVNLKHDMRLSLMFYGEKIVSLDVKQMQPTILAKILEESVGQNPFSDAIWGGLDVYVMLLNNSLSIKSRSEAKKTLLKLLFHPSQQDIGRLFKGDSRWVDWINNYKSTSEAMNPHTSNTHTNLAWLLQYSEVQVMTDVWSALKRSNIPFLSIHDDVLCRRSDKDRAYAIMDKELSKHFKKYEINIDH